MLTCGYKALYDSTAVIHLYSQICFWSPRTSDPSSRGVLLNVCASLSVIRCYNYHPHLQSVCRRGWTTTGKKDLFLRTAFLKTSSSTPSLAIPVYPRLRHAAIRGRHAARNTALRISVVFKYLYTVLPCTCPPCLASLNRTPFPLHSHQDCH